MEADLIPMTVPRTRRQAATRTRYLFMSHLRRYHIRSRSLQQLENQRGAQSDVNAAERILQQGKRRTIDGVAVTAYMNADHLPSFGSRFQHRRAATTGGSAAAVQHWRCYVSVNLAVTGHPLNVTLRMGDNTCQRLGSQILSRQRASLGSVQPLGRIWINSDHAHIAEIEFGRGKAG